MTDTYYPYYRPQVFDIAFEPVKAKHLQALCDFDERDANLTPEEQAALSEAARSASPLVMHWWCGAAMRCSDAHLAAFRRGLRKPPFGNARWGAQVALAVRPLIGQYGFTQHDYDVLTGPWRTVIGPLHPDDEVLS
jgi:hypothetical protein